MTARQKKEPLSHPEQANGTVPQEQSFQVDLTANELNLIHLFLTRLPIEGALEKQIAAVLQAKIEQVAQANGKAPTE